MGWRRLGLVYAPSGERDWARGYAALPLPVLLNGPRVRVFFSTRDVANRSSVGWVDIVVDPHPEIVGEATAPALAFGTPGMFDDSGIGVGSLVRDQHHSRLYYMGWNLGVTTPWRNSIGVAVGSVEAASFERLYQGPIMDRSPEDPFTLSYPWVIRLSTCNWYMWYGSHTRWGAGIADMNHVIKVAHSRDGLRWDRDPHPAIRHSRPGEFALTRPAVLHENGTFRMWFATRGERYRIGYAESRDCRTWTRADERYGLLPSNEGWDAEMTCYPCPFRHDGRLYLAYNGNGYGRTGFGLALWDD
jgi:hypothetical protein